MEPGDDKRRCDAKTRGGGKCKQPAGAGTEHLGEGACARHGGLLPGPNKAAARELMKRRAVELMGDYQDATPHELLLNTVKIGYVRAQLASDRAAEFVGTDDELRFATYSREMLRDAAQMAALAIKAGVQERLVRLAERQGHQLSAAFAAAIGVLPDLTDDQRMAAISEYGRQLRVIDATVVDEPLELSA